jgi:HEAT repeat protein
MEGIAILVGAVATAVIGIGGWVVTALVSRAKMRRDDFQLVVDNLNNMVREAKEDLKVLREQHADCLRMSAAQAEQIRELTAQLASLTEANKDQEARIRSLEGRATSGQAH